MPPSAVHEALRAGGVIPAHPLALTAERRLDQRRQRALTRYYVASGAAGVAVGVHTTQFAIREAGLLPPVLALAAETLDAAELSGAHTLVRVAGICGPTAQAVAEARLAADLRYHVGLLSLGALRDASDDQLIAHARAVADVLPLVGFYLQPLAGGRPLSYAFWRRFLELPNLVAIKVAPFDRYRTIDVVRAVADSGRDDVALYTGNDDSIVADLLTPFRLGQAAPCWFVGGLLGQFAVWTSRAVAIVEQARRARSGAATEHAAALALGAQLTDANAAIFDAANGFHGCIPGIHEVLRRQGLLAGRWCLDPAEELSPGQVAEIDRVLAAHPQLRDDDFVAAHRDEWLR
jgi:dihydrodipicolinate synthase/N-acetylneuraminate lyase